jgi:hypothetical protein
MPVQVFRSLLAVELAIPVDSTYEPLNRSPLYQPRTKPRHRLNDEYWALIDPTRFDLPVAERAHIDEAVVIPHEVLLNDWHDLSRLPAAIIQIQSDAKQRRPKTATAHAAAE